MSKKCCGNCFTFTKTFKTVGHSNSGKETGKIEHKDFCTKFHTEVNPSRGICRHWNGVEVKDE